MIPWLDPNTPFPPIQAALADPNGLLAAGADLSVDRLLDAYRHGIFPWFGEGDPILWWSPDPRMVLFPEELKISRSLEKTMRNRVYEIRFDTAFDDVMAGCAEPGPDRPGTWITGEMREAYNRLHRLGYAHSVETWMNDTLAGGLYGVAIGAMFYGESMFTRSRDASKLALVALARHCIAEHIELIDCQMHTRHLASLGARDMPRRQFMRMLSKLVDYPRKPALWTYAGYRNAPQRAGNVAAK